MDKKMIVSATQTVAKYSVSKNHKSWLEWFISCKNNLNLW